MKTLLTSIIIMLIFSQMGICQNIKEGAYLSIEEFKENTPSYTCPLEIIERTKGNIRANGGNDYKIEADKSDITKKSLKKKVWGVYNNDTLYLNGIPITGYLWYAKVEIYGKYCFLRAAYPMKPEIQEELGLDNKEIGNMFGAVGGAIQGAKVATMRVPIIYNLETSEKLLLTEHNIAKLIKAHSILTKEFNDEPNKTEEKILLKYLTRLNEMQ